MGRGSVGKFYKYTQTGKILLEKYDVRRQTAFLSKNLIGAVIRCRHRREAPKRCVTRRNTSSTLSACRLPNVRRQVANLVAGVSAATSEKSHAAVGEVVAIRQAPAITITCVGRNESFRGAVANKKANVTIRHVSSTITA